MVRILAVGVILLLPVAAQEPPRPLVINGDVTSLAFQPSFAVHPGGGLTYIWNSYHRHQEKILSIALEEDRLVRSRLLSAGAGVYYQPVVVATGPRSGWAFWARQTGPRWQIVGRQLINGDWRPVIALTPQTATALAPAATAMGSRVFLAWEDHSVSPQRIFVRLWDGKQWLPPLAVSPAGVPAYRPAWAASQDGQLWAFWDSYDGHEYSVHGKQLLPQNRPPERLSAPGRDCLRPVAVASGDVGIAVAWVSHRNVIGGEGALDHWDTVQVSAYRQGAWQSLGDAADLRHGLQPRIEPPGGMWGYAGRRRHPMLAEEGNGFWLLWERKAIHDGRSDTTGQLCGRRFDGTRWMDPVILYDGFVDYRIPTDARIANGRLTIVGKDIHHYYSTVSMDLNAGLKFSLGEFPGWKPVTLPLRPDAPRPSTEIAGKRYSLYWGDLHVHTELTPDAEGEVDELIHFARDKARIDVLVMTENDSNSWMNNNPQGAFRDHLLTQSEYALSTYYARKYTENGRFVALPGYEWSQRTDDNRPNHRTVIFTGEDTPIVRHPENRNDFNELCDMVEAAGGLMTTQHEAFRLVDRACDAHIEVATGWSIYIDPPDKIHVDLSAGFRVGFVATSDGHRRNPGAGGGLTGIWAAELTPEAILEALKQRRVYATNGSRIVIDARANGVFMGADVEAKGPVELTLKVQTPKPLVRAGLVRDGAEIHVVRGQGRSSIEEKFTDTPGAGFHWYYWRIEQEGVSPRYPGNMKVAEGHLAWSSPHRVRVR